MTLRVPSIRPSVLALALLGIAGCAKQHGGAHWEYSGEKGPDAWGQLDERFRLCEQGQQQSPINIDLQTTQLDEALAEIEFNYKPRSLSLENNGHSIKLDGKNAGGIRLGGDQYDLLQVHFHTPSEHTLNDEAADMVAHLVHQNKAQQLAVVGVFMNQGVSENSLISTLWQSIPTQAGQIVNTQASINVADLLPESKGYYTYPGSLTTPPCSEGVRWLVLKQPVTISESQLKQYQALYPNSVRPVQPVNNRQVQQSPSL